MTFTCKYVLSIVDSPAARPPLTYLPPNASGGLRPPAYLLTKNLHCPQSYLTRDCTERSSMALRLSEPDSRSDKWRRPVFSGKKTAADFKIAPLEDGTLDLDKVCGVVTDRLKWKGNEDPQPCMYELDFCKWHRRDEKIAVCGRSRPYEELVREIRVKKKAEQAAEQEAKKGKQATRRQPHFKVSEKREEFRLASSVHFVDSPPAAFANGNGGPRAMEAEKRTSRPPLSHPSLFEYIVEKPRISEREVKPKQRLGDAESWGSSKKGDSTRNWIPTITFEADLLLKMQRRAHTDALTTQERWCCAAAGCSKAFSSEAYLQAHVLRRHPQLAPPADAVLPAVAASSTAVKQSSSAAPTNLHVAMFMGVPSATNPHMAFAKRPAADTAPPAERPVLLPAKRPVLLPAKRPVPETVPPANRSVLDAAPPEQGPAAETAPPVQAAGGKLPVPKAVPPAMAAQAPPGVGLEGMDGVWQLPCRKCGRGCTGQRALSMHESVCRGPLLPAAPHSSAQAAMVAGVDARATHTPAFTRRPPAHTAAVAAAAAAATNAADGDAAGASASTPAQPADLPAAPPVAQLPAGPANAAVDVPAMTAPADDDVVPVRDDAVQSATASASASCRPADVSEAMEEEPEDDLEEEREDVEESGPSQPPPPSWIFPRETMQIEVEIDDEEEVGRTRWVAATVQSVHLDSTFSAEIHGPDGTWIDWFTWEDEDIDWRRDFNRDFNQSVAPHLPKAPAAQAPRRQRARDDVLPEVQQQRAEIGKPITPLRWMLSEEDKSLLEGVFHRSRYLSLAERKEIAARLKATEKQVETWFGNRRARDPSCVRDDAPPAQDDAQPAQDDALPQDDEHHFGAGVRGAGVHGAGVYGAGVHGHIVDDQFQVEAVRSVRVIDDSVTEYLIKWEGWAEEDNSWEPAENVSDDVIDAFEQQQKALPAACAKRGAAPKVEATTMMALHPRAFQEADRSDGGNDEVEGGDCDVHVGIKRKLTAPPFSRPSKGISRERGASEYPACNGQRRSHTCDLGDANGAVNHGQGRRVAAREDAPSSGLSSQGLAEAVSGRRMAEKEGAEPEVLRVTITSEQLLALIESFEKEPYPNSETKHALAKQLGMPARSVLTWFYNRRQRCLVKEKTSKEEERPAKRLAERRQAERQPAEKLVGKPTQSRRWVPADKGYLEEVFRRTHHPTPAEREEVATRLRATEHQVQRWFQNRRYLERTGAVMVAVEEVQKDEAAGGLAPQSSSVGGAAIRVRAKASALASDAHPPPRGMDSGGTDQRTKSRSGSRSGSRGPSKSSQTEETEPGTKLMRTASGRMATSLRVASSMIAPNRSGARREPQAASTPERAADELDMMEDLDA